MKNFNLRKSVLTLVVLFLVSQVGALACPCSEHKQKHHCNKSKKSNGDFLKIRSSIKKANKIKLKKH